jgi:predicted short-subunit dehydrogenase-like oxidoreductase (DUF2520 family)
VRDDARKEARAAMHEQARIWRAQLADMPRSMVISSLTDAELERELQRRTSDGGIYCTCLACRGVWRQAWGE